MSDPSALLTILRALIGVACLIGIAWAFSSARRAVRWRIVAGGLILQVLLAFLLLRAPGASAAMGWVSARFVEVINCSQAGSEFIFGDYAISEKSGFVFAFQVLPIIIFFSALTSLLYYWGVLQRIVWAVAWVMTKAMHLSGAESLAAAANVFLGQTEAPLVIKPYIPKMTRSEIMALMTGGMATIAGSVMGAYIGFLGGDDPQAQAEFARMFLCASLMNAPAALLVAKLLVPESQPVNEDLSVPRSHAGRNALDAIATGTTQGLKLALNVAAMLVAFLALIALLNWILGLVGGLGQDGGAINRAVASASGGVFDSLSLEALLGFLFAPVAWLIGIESSDLLLIGQLLGKKVAANEFVAYLDLGSMKAASQVSPRSVFIATFALCGFANFGSIGIQIGGIGALAPEQRPMLAELGLKALLGGTLASLLTASLAGMFFAG